MVQPQTRPEARGMRGEPLDHGSVLRVPHSAAGRHGRGAGAEGRPRCRSCVVSPRQHLVGAEASVGGAERSPEGQRLREGGTL